MKRVIDLLLKTVLTSGILLFPVWLASPLYAQSAQQAGNVIFKIPSGWQRLDKNGAVLLLPGDTKQGDCVIIIAPGQELQGGFPNWFDTIVGKLVADAKVLEKTDNLARKTEAGYNVIYKAVITEDEQGGRFYHLFYGMNPGQRAELFALLVKNEQLLTKYEQPFLDFVSSVEFANLRASAADANAGSKRGAKPAVPGSGAKLLLGRWYRTGYYYNSKEKYYDGGAMVSNTSSSAGYLDFFEDGTYYSEYLVSVNNQYYSGVLTEKISGQYEVTGKNITLTFKDKSTEKIKNEKCLILSNDKLSYEGIIYVKDSK